MKVFVIAGEPSGDRLGGALMAGLKALCPGVTFEGVGGPEMEAEGLSSLFEMSELSVMGIAEVLPRYPQLHARMRQTAARAVAARPDVIVTIDSPDFCLRVLRRVRAEAPGIRTVHYVAPTVWAWRPHRAEKMTGLVDQVLTLFPFEPPYMEAAGMRADFVGHPVVAERQAGAEAAAAFRAEHGLGAAPVVLVLPGSRRGEVARLAPIFGEALRPVLAARGGARVVVPAAAPVAGPVIEAVAGWPGEPVVLDPRDTTLAESLGEKRAAFRAADVALAASGTVSLELAAAGTPMVVAYDMAWLSRQIIKAMLRIDTVTLVNLVSETRAVPEFLGKECRPGPIGAALLDLLHHPEGQAEALRLTMERLGRGGEAPGLRAARAVLDGLKTG
ncbi:lipid-A-disaccharide synthase [Ovoidimarina sediminis]|uniref:lipid-A-disaccharide synthase n=1 Tax=Ovoidimarina sediminis TaxID=3079856 RepID=UPI002912905B|nr:lipid-A-disaccharide synthase [Rhodophyticola sp. MJ-SS7]MDU8941900.1 lipid-A-disaccharide synthase [Rhodophyticola sp. MJ-SS7]